MFFKAYVSTAQPLPPSLPPSQDEYSLLVEKWNTQRGQALAHALLKVLYPQLEKELRMTLIQEAREAVLHVSRCESCK